MFTPFRMWRWSPSLFSCFSLSTQWRRRRRRLLAICAVLRMNQLVDDNELMNAHTHSGQSIEHTYMRMNMFERLPLSRMGMPYASFLSTAIDGIRINMKRRTKQPLLVSFTVHKYIFILRNRLVFAGTMSFVHRSRSFVCVSAAVRLVLARFRSSFEMQK